jgi:hypothetical protein
MNSMHTTLPSLLLIACALSACKNDPQPVTLRDSQGNFVTTADYEAMDREQFIAAIARRRRAGAEAPVETANAGHRLRAIGASRARPPFNAAA